MREHLSRDMLAAIAEWQRASGSDRNYWRRIAQRSIAEFRHRYLVPERAAFNAAVARSQLRRAA